MFMAPAGVTGDQLIVFGALAATLVLFVWNRWRFDLVALLALLVSTLAGLVPPDRAFEGLGHPAVVTVAAVLVLSRGLLNAGVVDVLARHLARAGQRPWAQVASLTGLVALCSGVMNNVGALALFMPVAAWMSRSAGRSASLLLMPLAFGSLLGGTLTLIGTPPNIIIAAYRQETQAPAFGMFDFLPAGAAITVTGVLFIAVVGWRLTPLRKEADAGGDLFEISAYLAELRVPEGARFAGRTLHDLVTAVEDADIVVVGMVRDRRLRPMPSVFEVLREEDVLLVEADSESLDRFLAGTGLVLAEEAGTRDEEADRPTREARTGELTLAEAIVTPDSILVGRTATALEIRDRFGVNVLAVARHGRRLRARLSRIRFLAGDILLVQAGEDALASALNALGALPLASRGLRLGKPRKVALASVIFAAALALIALDLVPSATALVGAAVAMVATGLIAPSEVYKAIDMPVIVLLAALLPVGHALEDTGGSQLIADGLLAMGRAVPPAGTVAILMGAVMLLSNVVNNAAAAVLAAPVALNLARGLDASADPLLMAVAIGSSCAFLTPIGHQSNTLVMAPGGYRFGDYWRMGLPLSLLVVATAVPVILWRWPL